MRLVQYGEILVLGHDHQAVLTGMGKNGSIVCGQSRLITDVSRVMALLAQPARQARRQVGIDQERHAVRAGTML